MKSLESALQIIKENPGKYIGKKSLERLDRFIKGYVSCQGREDGTYPEWREKFMEYVQEKYEVKECIGVSDIIRHISLSDEEAFDKYYELLEEFYHIK